MNRSTLPSALLSISLDRSLKQSLQAQLTQALRQLVHAGRLQPGDRLPSSRILAAELSVSRVTITGAVDQLVAEGYLEGRHGAGTFVAADLPDLPAGGIAVPTAPVGEPDRQPEPLRPFENTMPDQRLFPFRDWARLFEQVWRTPSPALLSRPDPFGWYPLRSAIAAHLRHWRGINCDPAQIVVTSGLVEAIEIITATALPTGSRVMVEEPGYRTLRTALTRCGMSCANVPVDASGFDIEAALTTHRDAAAAAITPSRQFPLGMTMPLARRLALLNWAARTGGYIVEDDFDGEFRYQGQPLPAIMSLDDADCVIYAGSFSKVMFPSLRLGFIVLPWPLIEPAARTIATTGARASMVAQPVLARFIEDGTFATHIRRMRRIYAGRQRALVAAIERDAEGLLTAAAEPGGMHLVVRLSDQVAQRVADTTIAAAAEDERITVQPLSEYFAGSATAQGLILGYAAFDEMEIDAGIAKLSEIVRRL